MYDEDSSLGLYKSEVLWLYPRQNRLAKFLDRCFIISRSGWGTPWTILHDNDCKSVGVNKIGQEYCGVL